MKIYAYLLISVIILEPCVCQFSGDMLGLALLSGMGETGGTGGRSQGMTRESVTRAVHFIVGPNTSPDFEILNFASSLGREPTSTEEMMRYISHMQRIARAKYGPFLVSIAKQNAASSPVIGSKPTANTATPNTSIGGGKTLAELRDELDTMIFQRALQWFQQTRTRESTGAGAGMTGMELFLPALLF